MENEQNEECSFPPFSIQILLKIYFFKSQSNWDYSNKSFLYPKTNFQIHPKPWKWYGLYFLILGIYHMLHGHRNCRCILIKKYTIIDISLHDQVNIKGSAYSNNCYRLYVNVIKQPVLRSMAYCCLLLSIEDEWWLRCEQLFIKHTY
jgi:hypothetical protein